jgi:hypothetical protein
MHLDDERLQRLLHGEVAAHAAAAARAHVAGCAECRQRFEDAEREERWLAGVLRAVDHAAPAVSAESLARRASRGAVVWGRRAAMVALGLAVAGGAWALPGSPLRRWVAAAGRWLAAPPAPPDSLQASSAPAAGIAVAPGARLTIVIAPPPRAATVTVVLSDSADVVARAGAGTASFLTDAGRLRITVADPAAHLEIALPRAAAWVEILVEGRRLLLKDGSRVVTDATPDATGRYVLPLAAPR